jgi:hypothetical protein
MRHRRTAVEWPNSSATSRMPAPDPELTRTTGGKVPGRDRWNFLRPIVIRKLVNSQVGKGGLPPLKIQIIRL